MFKKKVVSKKVAVKKPVVSKKNKKVFASKKEPKISSFGCIIVDDNLPKNKKSKKSVNTITWKVGSHKFTAELVNVKREY